MMPPSWSAVKGGWRLANTVWDESPFGCVCTYRIVGGKWNEQLRFGDVRLLAPVS